MKYFLLFLLFLVPIFSFGAITVNVATSTPTIGVVVSGIPASSLTSVTRLFTPNQVNTIPATACHTFSGLTGNISYYLNKDFFVLVTNCRPIAFGTYTISRYGSATSTTPLETVTFNLVNDPFDHRSLIVLLFLVGALLAILRPLISSFLLKR